ncbi:MAG: hypothetical protein JSU72_05030 [Deltaproteobacteria bacterium]|nr:MAG: hypothetical protein JSU72_05030 [Deltaproteobacteria bacterium]
MVRTVLLARFSWCWLVIVFCTIPAESLIAGERADRLWDFAGYLYLEKDFYRALGEYQRFLFLFPTDSRAGEAELQIGRCYREGGELAKAGDHFLGLYNRKTADPVGQQALLEAITILEEEKQYVEGIYWAQRFIEHYPQDPKIDDLYFRLAWLQIDTGGYEQALVTLGLIRQESDRYSRAKSLIGALQHRPDTAKKSPTLAGVLAGILPGLGHLYAGRPGEAAASFLLNAAFIAGAVVAFENDSPALGGILIFFELGWYTGGIRSAVQAARTANEQQEQRYRQDLKGRYGISLGLLPGRDRLAMAVRLTF